MEEERETREIEYFPIIMITIHSGAAWPFG